MRIGPAGQERPVVLLAGSRVGDLSSLTRDIDGPFLRDGGVDRIRRHLGDGRIPVTGLPEERIGPPIARPGNLVLVGMNYSDHAAESGHPLPDEPVFLLKATNTIVGPNDDLVLPPRSTKVDWEVELAVVISAPARYLSSPAHAQTTIGGYVIANDVTEREYQFGGSGGQWGRGKGLESFCPLGPWLVTPEEVGDPQRLALQSRVNGEARQSASTSMMIFSVPELIWYISQYMVLEPGDVICTGTPAGVALSGRFPYLTVGDTVELSIERLGSQRQVCVTESAAPR